MMSWPDLTWIAGFGVAFAVATVAWRLRALTPSGLLAATVTGGLIVGSAGWWAGATLVAFFLTASLLSHLAPDQETAIGQERGNRRDWIQVIANGGIPCLLAIVAGLVSQPDPWLLAYAAAVAAATSDTWATEVGRLTLAPARALLNLQEVPPGTSGAVSAPGTTGAAAGAWLIAGMAAMGSMSGWWMLDISATAVLLGTAGAGFLGSLADSVLGAAVQARRWCPACEEDTEQRVHRCGTRTLPNGGVRWFTNDVVNVLSVLFAATCGLVTGIVLA
jgi:uncharacterized protein (TIGR00297 family)